MLFFSHPSYDRHEMYEGHPECPARTQAILAHLTETGLLADLDVRKPNGVTDAALARVHDPAYLEMVKATAPEDGLVPLDPDTAMAPGSLHAARLAAGALEESVKLVLQGKTKRTFCCGRPPGHHAEHDRAMGFCLYGNVAIGASCALQHDSIERVAVLDFDVHHGNGTIDIFKDTPEVMVASSFQHPHYPHRYFDLDRPNIVNTPLRAGTSGAEFRKAIERDWIPAVEKFKPQLLFVSAGFDAHEDDPLGDLRLKEDDFKWVTQLIVDLADKHCEGRVISSLEGGYHLPALARSVEAHLIALKR